MNNYAKVMGVPIKEELHFFDSTDEESVKSLVLLLKEKYPRNKIVFWRRPRLMSVLGWLDGKGVGYVY